MRNGAVYPGAACTCGGMIALYRLPPRRVNAQGGSTIWRNTFVYLGFFVVADCGQFAWSVRLLPLPMLSRGVGAAEQTSRYGWLGLADGCDVLSEL